ncbi:MAG: energy transducer TonB [Parvularcula sp.]|jgi:protein TonB|nr:energy transducer TonB [Parvularcula sp.]
MSANKTSRLLLPSLAASVFLGTVIATPAAAEPALVAPVAPEYPRAAERRNIEGHVKVSIDVAADGSVANVTVLESVPAGIFDTSAVNAVQRWRFEPNNPANGIIKQVRFQLEG